MMETSQYKKKMIKECTLLEPLYCSEEEEITAVAKKLREHVIRYIYVVNAKKTPVGVISTTDMNNRVVAEGKDPTKLKARDIMTKPVHAFEENDDERNAYQGCLKNNVATCPITKDGAIVGVVTIHELLKKITEINT